MITVNTISGEELAARFSAAGLELNEFSGGVVARDNSEILGECLYYIYEKGITVLSLAPQDDLSLADGVLRSALHVAACRSAMDARYGETAPEVIFERLGFVKDKSEKTLDIDKLFSPCCSCG